MRHAPASQLIGRRRAPLNLIPREGTRIRALYDLFQANKGRPIAYTRPRNAQCLDTLINCYGLDIRCLRRGQWVLAGEWFGSTYIDHIADHLNASGEAA